MVSSLNKIKRLNQFTHGRKRSCLSKTYFENYVLKNPFHFFWSSIFQVKYLFKQDVLNFWQSLPIYLMQHIRINSLSRVTVKTHRHSWMPCFVLVMLNMGSSHPSTLLVHRQILGYMYYLTWYVRVSFSIVTVTTRDRISFVSFLHEILPERVSPLNEKKGITKRKKIELDS